jgi:hypothetical protein
MKVADSSLQQASLLLGFLTSHHHTSGEIIVICIGGIFKQEQVVTLGLLWEAYVSEHGRSR